MGKMIYAIVPADYPDHVVRAMNALAAIHNTGDMPVRMYEEDKRHIKTVLDFIMYIDEPGGWGEKVLAKKVLARIAQQFSEAVDKVTNDEATNAILSECRQAQFQTLNQIEDKLTELSLWIARTRNRSATLCVRGTGE